MLCAGTWRSARGEDEDSLGCGAGAGCSLNADQLGLAGSSFQTAFESAR